MKIIVTFPYLLRRLGAPLLILSVALGAPFALYAVGAWVLTTLGAPRNVTEYSDVVSTGMPADGSIFGTTGFSATTVKTAPFAVPNPGGLGATTVGIVSLNLCAEGSAGNKTFGPASAPFSALSSGYPTQHSAGATSGLSANNLLVTVNGQKYAFEAWTNDSDRKLDGAAENTSAAFGANPSLAFTNNATNPNGSPGQFAIGKLTASGAGSAEIGLAGSTTDGVPEANTLGIQYLVAVPEPGSATLAVFGGLGLLLLRHRKSGAV